MGNNPPKPQATAASIANQPGVISAGHGSGGVQNAPEPTKAPDKAKTLNDLTDAELEAAYNAMIKRVDEENKRKKK